MVQGPENERLSLDSGVCVLPSISGCPTLQVQPLDCPSASISEDRWFGGPICSRRKRTTRIDCPLVQERPDHVRKHHEGDRSERDPGKQRGAKVSSRAALALCSPEDCSGSRTARTSDGVLESRAYRAGLSRIISETATLPMGRH